MFVLIVFFAGWARADYPGDVVKGEKIYLDSCVACHAEDGAGAFPGVPDFASKNSHLVTKTHETLMDHVLNGFKDERGVIAMPPKGGNGNLTTEDAENVLKYLHEKFHYRK